MKTAIYYKLLMLFWILIVGSSCSDIHQKVRAQYVLNYRDLVQRTGSIEQLIRHYDISEEYFLRRIELIDSSKPTAGLKDLHTWRYVFKKSSNGQFQSVESADLITIDITEYLDHHCFTGIQLFHQLEYHYSDSSKYIRTNAVHDLKYLYEQ